MKVFNKDYPLSIYKHNTFSRWVVVFEDKKQDDMYFCFEFEGLTDYVPKHIHENALNKRYTKRTFTNVRQDVKRRLAFILLQMGYNEPLQNLNRR